MLTKIRPKIEVIRAMPAIAKYLTEYNEITDRDVYVNPDRFPHMLIGGITRSGKSSWINSIVANLLHEPYVMWGIDCKEGMELFPWRNRFERLASTPDEATPLMRDLYWLVKDRSRMMSERGVRSWPIEWGPKFILFIDEVVEFLSERADRRLDESMKSLAARASSELKSRLNDLISLASIAAAAGVTLVLSTQNPTVDILPTSVKANLDFRVCCRVKSSQSYGVILGHGSNDKSMENISTQAIPFDMPGTALIDWGEGIIRKARAFLYEDDEIQNAMNRFDYQRWADHHGIKCPAWSTRSPLEEQD